MFGTRINQVSVVLNVFRREARRMKVRGCRFEDSRDSILLQRVSGGSFASNLFEGGLDEVSRPITVER